MLEGKKLVQDETLRKWLQEFKSESTKTTYLSALRKFKTVAGIADLGEYIAHMPDAAVDVRKLLNSLEGKPSKTIKTYVGAVKVFLQDNGVNVNEDDWRKMGRRGFMPKRVKAETKDKKPSKIQLKQILNYASIKCRSLILFLVSSGARIGETVQLKIEDFNLDADPPFAQIRDEYTKAGESGRTVYFSYEARDAIKDWLRVKDATSKHDGGNYESPLMFPWNTNTARFMWNLACDKAELGAIDVKTGRRILHLHSLRKFFRTKIGLDLDTTNALMGHSEYLDDAYLRLEETGEIGKAYKEAMPNVSVYTVENQELREQATTIEQKNIELTRRIESTEQRFLKLESMIAELKKLIDKT